MWIKLYVYSLITALTIGYSHAQVDTEFWFVAPEVSSGHGDRPIYLRISTQNQASTVEVTQPANANRQLIKMNIPANTTQTIDLTGSIDMIETNVPGTVMKTGIRIVSTTPITAYYEEGSPWNSEIFALKGKNALGNRFIIAGQNLYDNGQYTPTPYSSFDVVATKNNTVVTVKPTRPIFGHANETTITVRLNAGETYSFRKMTTSAIDNPIGTIVESSKPIAITIKDDSLINGACRDIVGDQIVPVLVAGVEYVVIKGFLSSTEYLFITATEDNTNVFIGGASQPLVTLHAGELFRYPIFNKSTYVVASKTIYVFHVTGFGCEMGMALLPSINCKGSQQIGFTRSTSEFFGLNILVKKDGIGQFILNSSSALIPSSAFSAVPGTNDKWYTAQIGLNTSQIPVGQASLISNDKQSFQVGLINGDAASTCRYGYFSAFSTLNLGDDLRICEGESATLDAGGGKESYLWSTGAITQKLEVSTPGKYWVKAVKEECQLYDTINVKVEKGKVDLGPDVVICKSDTTKIDGKNNFSWKWSDGSIKQFLATTVPGKYSVLVSTDIGCPASDTIVVSWYKRPDVITSQLKLNYVSVDTLKEADIGLAWTAIPDNASPKNSVAIFKRMVPDDNWKLQSSWPLTKTTYLDKGNQTDANIYEYYISLFECYGESATSNIQHSLRLSGKVDSLTDVVSLNWNPYLGWKDGVSNYEIWRKLDGALRYTWVASIYGTENQFISPIGADGFIHQYVIRAKERNGSGESWSNSIQLELQHPVYIPNVFTPNGDVYNQYFEILKIQLYKDSDFAVFSRWGSKVYSAHGYTNNWDGEDLDSGVYFYMLDLKRGNKIMKGSLSILR